MGERHKTKLKTKTGARVPRGTLIGHQLLDGPFGHQKLN